MSDPMTPAVPDPTVEAPEITVAIKAQNPDLETAWRTIAWWEQTCDYWYEQTKDARARAAAPDTLRDRLQALCDAAMRNKWHLGAEAVSVTVAQVLAVVGEGP